MKKIKISACMIVKNEEKHIEKCLQSIVNQVDEIIIVDTGSNDKTVEIAKKYTNNIFYYSWDNDFSKARNYSLRYATGEYILILDADEFLETDEKIKMNINPKVDCYSVRINNIQSNGGSYYHNMYRLFKSDIGISFVNPLHEQLKFSGDRKYRIEELSISIFHDGYLDDVQVEKNKNQRNILILENDILSNKNSYNIYNLGREKFIGGYYKEALNLFKESIALEKNTLFTPDLYNRILICLIKLNQENEFIDFIGQVIKEYPEETEIFFSAGSGYMEFERFKEAEYYFLKCIQMGDNGYQAREGVGSYISYLKLSEICYEVDDLVQSFDYLIKSLQLNSQYTPTLIHYFRVVEKSNIPTGDALQTLNLFFKIQNQEDFKKIIEVLYFLRSPYLNYFTANYNIQVKNNILAVTHILNNEYSKATKIFNEMESIPFDNLKDLLVLSLVNKKYNSINKFFEKNLMESKNISTLIQMILDENNFKLLDDLNLKDEIIIDLVSEVSIYLSKLKRHEEIKKLVSIFKEYPYTINKIIQKLLSVNEIYLVKSLFNIYSESLMKSELFEKTLIKWDMKKERYLID